MTENEAIELLSIHKSTLEKGGYIGGKDAVLEYDIAIKALEERQRYKVIEKSVIEILEKYVEYAEQKAAEYDEAGDIIAMDELDIEAYVYRNAIKIVKEAMNDGE